MYPSHVFRGVERSRHEVVGNQMEFNIMGDSVLDLTRSPMRSPRSSSNLTAVTSSSQLHAQFGGLNLAVLDMGCSSIVEDDRFQFQRDSQQQQLDHWHHGVFNTEYPANHNLGGVEAGVGVSLDCSVVVSKDKRGDYKVLRRLAQNREAAKKSRLRKKAADICNCKIEVYGLWKVT